MLTLFGGHDCTLDAKGRVLIPGALKKQLTPILNEGFIIKRSMFQQCLELYPMPVWNKQMRQINKLNRFIKKNIDFIRLFMAGVHQVELDGAGRLQIPRDLVLFAELKADIVLSSQTEIIEIWDKVKYEALNSSSEDIDKEQLAQDVMGNIPVEDD
ncbi:MAG: division/cell wall cluster transcriptional repressor MraZ [Bacteroidetes bacterium]|nr:division/cell wall cluster transcriptional repressor MraZ [Bacteroidota bacterium]